MESTESRFQKLLFLLVIAVSVSWLAIPDSIRYNINEVDVSSGKKLIDEGAVLIDVRPTKSFNEQHIAGAVSIPLEVLKIAIPHTLEYAKNKRILVYCGDGSTLGPKGTQALNEAGYSGAVNMKGGLGGWKDAGYSVSGAS